jgi:hypothetical protein
MEYILFGIISTFIWIGIEMWRAPMMSENGRIIKEGNKLKDLFKKTKKQ